MEGIDITDWSKLGSVVRAARLDAGLTQQELAERSSTARSWIARIEAGHRKAELEQLLRLLDALNLRIRLHPVAEDAQVVDEEQDPDPGRNRALAEFNSGVSAQALEWAKYARTLLDQNRDLTERSWADSAGANLLLIEPPSEQQSDDPEADA
jgi:transcriptional regulator with XRE-family HTH domain